MITSFTLENNLQLTLELDTPRFGLSPDALFGLAARQNPQRAFLFVSKVLGKHLPIPPGALLAAGKLLALALAGKTDGEYWASIINGAAGPAFAELWAHLEASRTPLPAQERTLFIGFAETATGLGQAVADCFSGESAYISTTRFEQTGGTPLTFDEAHSHARTHLLYLDPNDAFLRGCRRAVLIDDEFTTGNTAFRLVERLHAAYGIRRFVLLALLDNSSGEQRRAVEKRLGVEIEMISLLKSRIVSLENGAPPAPALADLTGAAGSAPTLLDPGIFLPGTGRRLMTQERLAALRRACRTAADKIGAPDAPRTLYLGSGELIYAPALIAGFCGGGAFHSTTQSPVFPLPGSAIVSGVRFDPADCYSAAGYLYNVPDGAYERAYLFAERGAFIERGARQLTQYLSMRGIKSVSVVML